VDRKAPKKLGELREFVRRNIMEFREKFPELRDRTLKICTESNGRWDGESVAEVLSSEGIFRGDIRGRDLIGKIEFMSDNGLKEGITKTARRTVQYVLDTSNHILGGQLCFHRRVGTSNREITDVNRIMNELKDELARFRWPDSDPDNPRYHSQQRLTGKFKGENGTCIFFTP
jgi:hypothetical protein